MRPVTKYETEDGRVFNTPEKAFRHEALRSKMRDLEKGLKPRPEDPGCRFANGYGFIQQDRDAVLTFKSAILEETKPFLMERYAHVYDYNIEELHPMSGIGRLIDEICPEPIGMAWRRLCNIDTQYREWGQPYYAINPDKGEQAEFTDDPLPSPSTPL